VSVRVEQPWPGTQKSPRAAGGGFPEMVWTIKAPDPFSLAGGWRARARELLIP